MKLPSLTVCLQRTRMEPHGNYGPFEAHVHQEGWRAENILAGQRIVVEDRARSAVRAALVGKADEVVFIDFTGRRI